MRDSRVADDTGEIVTEGIGLYPRGRSRPFDGTTVGPSHDQAMHLPSLHPRLPQGLADRRFRQRKVDMLAEALFPLP